MRRTMSCRDRSTYLPQFLFNIYSCSKCYSYLFPRGTHLESNGLKLTAKNDSSLYDHGTHFIPDINNQTVVREVCRTLDTDQCTKWTDCCKSAIQCCASQLNSSLHPTNLSTTEYCPRTWDGYACFGDTPAGTSVQFVCPYYIENVKEGATAVKTCTENGTWYRSPTSSLEWTDYTHCISKENEHAVLFIGLAFNIISFLLLLIACGIFLKFRQLRVQQRILLHLNLFLSFVIYAVITILWDFLLVYDRLNSSKDESRMYKNGIGCKFLYILLRYARSSNYFWMLCEGYYLYTLIVHAFKVPRTLVGYYAFGWGACWIPIGIYSIIRGLHEDFNKQCWVHPIDGYEWIIFTPNLICIIVNIYFFVSILRILLTQLQSHPNEPSNYRRALKATFVLVPLFGIQFLILVYRPHNYTYDIIQSIVKNAQGAIVSLIFCMFNGEVHSHLRNCVYKNGSGSRNGFKQNYSYASATQYTTVSTNRRNISGYEPSPDCSPLTRKSNHVTEMTVFNNDDKIDNL